MELSFADDALQAIAESRVKCDTYLGERVGASLRQRLCELVAADTLAIAASIPTLDLTAMPSRAGGFAIRLTAQHRLVFDLADSVAPVAENGEVDLTKVEAICIVAIEECDESEFGS